jgi:hypothetical protein
MEGGVQVSEDINVQIAVLKTELAHARKDLDEVKDDLRAIKETLQQATGGWKTLMLVAGVSSSVGALLMKFLPWFAFAPK